MICLVINASIPKYFIKLICFFLNQNKIKGIKWIERLKIKK